MVSWRKLRRASLGYLPIHIGPECLHSDGRKRFFFVFLIHTAWKSLGHDDAQRVWGAHPQLQDRRNSTKVVHRELTDRLEVLRTASHNRVVLSVRLTAGA